MEFEYIESQTANHTTFMYDTIYFQAPGGDDDFVEGDWTDEEDEDFDDRADDLDDQHEIQAGNDVGEPDPEDDYDITNPDPDDDHLPDDDLQ